MKFLPGAIRQKLPGSTTKATLLIVTPTLDGVVARRLEGAFLYKYFIVLGNTPLFFKRGGCLTHMTKADFKGFTVKEKVLSEERKLRQNTR